MTGQREKFRELEENVTGHVKLGDGSTVNIQGKGSVHFLTKREVYLSQIYAAI